MTDTTKRFLGYAGLIISWAAFISQKSSNITMRNNAIIDLIIMLVVSIIIALGILFSNGPRLTFFVRLIFLCDAMLLVFALISSLSWWLAASVVLFFWLLAIAAFFSFKRSLNP